MNGGFFNSLISRPITHRQRAEIQLESLLNEPEEALPTFARRDSDKLGQAKLSIEDVSKLLNTQLFIVERLVQAIYSSPTRTDEDFKALNRAEIQKLTRILNSTIVVRALLFFLILDEHGDQYITTEGVIQFYEKYLTELKTFDKNRLQEVISVLLQKFHLDQVGKLIYLIK
jgi:hypothetical protein